MTSTPLRSPTVGSTLVRWLRMRVPADPMQQRAQEAFAMLQVFASMAATLQTVLVSTMDGRQTTEQLWRIGLNGALAFLLLCTLVVFLRRGQVLTSARALGATLLAFNMAFAWVFGLRGAPTAYVMSLVIIAALALVERPVLLVAWAIAFTGTISFGILITPRYAFSPSPGTLITGILFSVAFFMLYLVEFRNAMLDAVAAVRSQATELTRANADLRKTIAERDALSDKLATSRRLEAMGRMAGSIAHDFNNVLTVIRGYADLIADATPKSDAHRADVEHLVLSVARASSVTREVLDFASPRAITLQPTDLGTFVLSLQPDFERLMAPRVSIAIEVSQRHCTVAADRAQLERLLLNLLTNARDVTPVGGVVRVQVSCDHETVFCRVADGGPGVPDDLRDRIFEPFFTTKGTTGGTGLGLASAYAIARQHGGSIGVSDAAGGGATFTLTLPRSVASSSSGTPAHETAVGFHHPGRPLDGMSAVLIEDDDALRRLATRLLQRAGANVTAFDNGVDAVTFFDALHGHSDAVHVVVTDLRLPRGSGADVIAAAKRYSPAIALVAISGFLEDPVVAQRAERMELFFLPKPFSEQELLSAIVEAQRMVSA